MEEFLLWLLATVGFTNILVHGKILDDDHLGFRSWLKNKLGKFSDVLECYECTGWWAGLLAGLALVSFNPLWFIGCAFAGAGVMHAYVNIMNLIESKTDFVVGDIGDEPDQSEQESTQ
jgi:hypothetical protein